MENAELEKLVPLRLNDDDVYHVRKWFPAKFNWNIHSWGSERVSWMCQ